MRTYSKTCFVVAVLLAAIYTSTIAAALSFIRVNQLGYTTHDHHATAVFMSKAEFPSLLNVSILQVATGQIVAALTVKPSDLSLGKWNDNFPFTFSLNFSNYTTGALRAATHSNSNNSNNNLFKICATSLSICSPTFPITSNAADLYAPLLPNALFFFQVQRDGSDQAPQAVKEFNRKPSHLTDQNAKMFKTPLYKGETLKGKLEQVFNNETVNVSNGWFDAGDYVKFVETTSYTLCAMLFMLKDADKSVLPSALREQFMQEAKFGLRWLLNMYDIERGILRYQVGIGNGNDKSILGDHDMWRLPEADDLLPFNITDTSNDRYYIKYRPVFLSHHATSDQQVKISPNLAGRTAAAYALCTQVFFDSDKELAKQCYIFAEDLYSRANTSFPKHAKLLTTAPFDFYPEAYVFHSFF